MREWMRKNDVFYKAVSLIIALLLWFFVVDSNNVTMTKKYSSMPVEFTGKDILESAGLIMTKGEGSVVTFVVSGKTDKLNMLKNSDVKVTADVAGITEPGTYNLNYRVATGVSDVTISKDTKDVTVEVDRMVTRSVPVVFKPTGELGEGYVASESRLRPDSVAVTGPEMILDTITEARVEYDITTITSAVEANVGFRLLDGQGNVVISPFISTDIDAVTLYYGVLQSARPEIVYRVNGWGFITEDMVDITLQPEGLEITGLPDAVTALDTIDLGVIDLKTVFESEEFTLNIPLTLPDGVTTADESISSVQVNIVPKGVERGQIIIPADQLPKSSLFEYRTGLDITVWTAEGESPASDQVDISMQFSEDDLSEGENQLPVRITSLRDDMLVAGSYSVTVEVEAQ